MHGDLTKKNGNMEVGRMQVKGTTNTVKTDIRSEKVKKVENCEDGQQQLLVKILQSPGQCVHFSSKSPFESQFESQCFGGSLKACASVCYFVVCQ